MATIPLGIDLTLTDKVSKQVEQLKSKFAGLNANMQRGMRVTAVSVKRLERNVKKFSQSFQKNWALMLAKVYLLVEAFRLFERSARFEQQRQAFNNLARSNNADADEMIKKLKEMSAQTLNTSQVMQQASRAMVLGLAPDQLPRLMEISRASARAFGEDVDFMFESIVLGIGRQSRMILDNLGIIVKAEDAYQEYADSLGRTVSSLTDMERRQAFANAVMKAGDRIIGDVNIQMKSQLENLQSLEAFWADLKITIGNVILFWVRAMTALFNFVQSGIQTVISGILQMVEVILGGVERLVVGLDNILSKLPAVENPLEGIRARIEQTKNSTSEWGLLTAGVALDYEETGNAIIKMMFAQDQATASSAKLRDAVNKVKNETKEASKEASKFVTDFSAGIASVAVEGKKFGDFFKNMWLDIAKTIIQEVVKKALQQVIAKLLIIQTLKKTLGGIFGGLFGGIFHDGGMIGVPKAHDGLAVDEVPIIAQTGEGILSRKGMRALGGEQALNQLNNGNPVGASIRGETNIDITINNPNFRSKEDIQELTGLIGEEIDRQLRYQKGF